MTPWKVTYSYRSFGINARCDESGGIPFFVSYYLDSNNAPDLVTGAVEITFPEGLDFDGIPLVLTVQPFLDIRHMFGGSTFSEYRIDNDYSNNRRIHISAYDRTLTFYAPDGHLTMFDGPVIINWNYKLGTGTGLALVLKFKTMTLNKCRPYSPMNTKT